MQTNEDKLLNMSFEPQRWLHALSKGVDKDIRRDQLILLAKPEGRAALYTAIRDGRYRVSPPHTAQIPKENGDFRTVYVNEPIDRVFLGILNDLLFEVAGDMVHPRCKSYQRGIGCGSVVQEVSRRICSTPGDIIGWKADLSKYFDSVPVRFIDAAFDAVEERTGHSVVMDALRDYYHSDIYFDTDGVLQFKYQSLKQGCAVAAWLADVILYDLDEKLSSLNGYYVRYSDDMLFVGEDYAKAMDILVEHLSAMEMGLNPKKVEYLSRNRWFKFLGFSIRGRDISLSKSRIKTFQKEIEGRTTKCQSTSMKRAIGQVNRYLYKGNGDYSWATQVLPICNVREDIETLNSFVIDCLRAVYTGKKRTGGLGYDYRGKNGCIARGKGRNVTSNRVKTEKEIPGYLSLSCMRNALVTSREAYLTLVSQLS